MGGILDLSQVPGGQTFRPVPQIGGVAFVAGAATGTWLLGSNGSLQLNGTNSGLAVTYLDPAAYSGSGWTVNLRLRAYVITNAVAPGVNLTFQLMPVTGYGGASGAYPTVTSVGAAVCAAVINTPAAGGTVVAVSSIVAFPSAGFYVIGVTFSATTAAGANLVLGGQLQAQLVG